MRDRERGRGREREKDKLFSNSSSQHHAQGNGDKHRLGHGTTAKEFAPRIVKALQGKAPVKDVACGLGHTLALLDDGTIYAWGNGSNGRLGLGNTNDRRTATLVAGLRDANIVRIFCGASHSLAISDDGALYCWGKNNQGQCGHGKSTDQLLPCAIDELSTSGGQIIRAAGGWEHTMALTRCVMEEGGVCQQNSQPITHPPTPPPFPQPPPTARANSTLLGLATRIAGERAYRQCWATAERTGS